MRVLIVLTSHDTLGNTGKPTGYYLSELTHALDVFTRAGLEVDFVSPKGGRPPMDGVSRDDALNRAFLDDARWTERLGSTLRPEEVDPTRYAALYVPGGHGTMFDLPQDTRVSGLIGTVYARGAVVAAVCHGPAALVNVTLPDGTYLVTGREVSAFTNEEEAEVKLTEVVPFLLESKLIERGARVTKVANFQKHVVVSERLVTGQNPASAAGVAEETVRLLTSR
ncbi:type 1 glutamine amidotransferase domain-containing protein [Myxococcus stipitatus]|uniref:type 1 glutamine amidotransferase domain-containing protein n=1 Tax=Myxococcus stipitatus TaxID=83455 RepID=UPI001F177D54|nr:type 1 glutamine amidotransferase domain-containing protein [Myxococcus stipitatus]MCE9668637.1 type 1 glutamine amidotransferase domain-containing protein [Myxococcus stipitatus]